MFDSREVVLADRLEVKFDKHANLGSTWSHTVAPKRGLDTLATLIVCIRYEISKQMKSVSMCPTRFYLHVNCICVCIVL